VTGKGRRPGTFAPSAGPGQTLRRRAEELVRETPARSPKDLEALAPEEARRTLQELRVHQIELELQNEELRRAQGELGVERARYFDLYDLAPVGYCTLSERGRVLEANLTAATLLGVVRGALVKQPISRFILDADQDIYYLHRKRLFESREPQSLELRMLKRDGTAFWAHLAAATAQDANGAPVCRLALSDISVRKAAEERLAQMEARYRGLLEAAPDAMVVVDQAGEIVLLNVQAEKQFGYHRDELVGQPVKNIIPEGFAERLIADDLRSAADALAQVIGTGIELVGRRKDGSEFPIEIMLSPLESAEGILVTAAIRDISVRKAAEGQYRGLLEETERAQIATQGL
jgi:PAS domain S-box-containing protein